jgi:hypothetical protein
MWDHIMNFCQLDGDERNKTTSEPNGLLKSTKNLGK